MRSASAQSFWFSRASGLRVAAALGLLLDTCGGQSGPPPPVTASGHQSLTAGTPTGATATTWSISPIGANFDQGCFCTTYEVRIAGQHVNFDNRQWRVTWTITLGVITADTGLADPDTAGSMAAADAGCNNAGNGVQHPAVDSVFLAGPNASSVRPYDASERDTFTWTHPDPNVIQPYACKHSAQGPHGHQGIIKVSVVHGAQECTVSYWGTHTGMSTDTGSIGKEQPDGPRCD